MPPSWSETLSAKADLAACRATLKGGSKSFFAASLLLPASLRGPASALYAFCRVADDAVDQGGDRHAALAHLRERLDRAYAGSPLPSPIDRAFADVVARHAVPRDLPEALLEGLAWDAAGRTYETLSDLNAYAARVAGAVGAMMTVLMGARAPEVLARACDLGVAMQLSNIARDVGEDARAGRLYLPRTWLREAGIDPEAWLARPLYDQRLGKVVRRLLVFADQLYLRACAGIGQLPLTCRPGIQAARILYAEIGREVERQGLDSVSARAVVPLRRKLGLLPKVFVAATLPGRLEALPPLPETRFLVDAVARAPTFSMDRSYSRVGFVLDLFEKLERLDRSGQVGRSAAGLS